MMLIVLFVSLNSNILGQELSINLHSKAARSTIELNDALSEARDQLHTAGAVRQVDLFCCSAYIGLDGNIPRSLLS